MYGAKWPVECWHVTGTQNSVIYPRTMHMIKACPRRSNNDCFQLGDNVLGTLSLISMQIHCFKYLIATVLIWVFRIYNHFCITISCQ